MAKAIRMRPRISFFRCRDTAEALVPFLTWRLRVLLVVEVAILKNPDKWCRSDQRMTCRGQAGTFIPNCQKPCSTLWYEKNTRSHYGRPDFLRLTSLSVPR